MRIRTVKPEFFQHWVLYRLEELYSMPFRVGFQAIWGLADREGRFAWKPQALKLNGLPYDKNVDPVFMMDALKKCGFIGRYSSSDGTREFGFVLNFPSHQNINPRETASRIPPPPRSAIEEATMAQKLADLDVDRLLESVKPPRTNLSPNAAAILGSSVESTESADASSTRRSREAHAAGGEGKGREGEGKGSDKSAAVGFKAPEQAPEQQESIHFADESESAASAVDSGDLSAEMIEGTSLALSPHSAALPAIRGARTKDAILARLAAVSAEVAAGTRQSLALAQLRKLGAELVFAYWMAKFNHPKARLDDARERLIVKRLEENDGDVSELLYALDGAFHDDHIMGRKPDSTTIYDGLETLFRSRAQVERFANTRKSYKESKPHKAYVQYLVALEGKENAAEEAVR